MCKKNYISPRKAMLKLVDQGRIQHFQVQFCFCYRDSLRSQPAAAQWAEHGAKAVRAVHGQALMLLMSFVQKVMAMKDERTSTSASLSLTCVRMVAAGTQLAHSHVAVTKATHWMRMVLSAWVRFTFFNASLCRSSFSFIHLFEWIYSALFTKKKFIV